MFPIAQLPDIVIFANGEPSTDAHSLQLLNRAQTIICCDGAVQKLLNLADNDFSKDVIYIKKDVNEVIFRIDQVYFIINSSSLPTNITLPKELQNNNHFCLNCNHELYFGESLHLDSFEFYLIECNI